MSSSQSFNRLLKARLPENILNAVVVCCWEANGNEGKPPAIKIENLSNPDWWDFPSNDNAIATFRELHKQWQKISKEAMDLHLEETKEDREALLACHPDSTDEQLRAIVEKRSPEVTKLDKKNRDFFMSIAALAQGFHLPSIDDRIQTIHEHWRRARKTNPKLGHPLAPIVRQWLTEQTAERIDAEYDRTHPVAVIKHPMGSIREVNFVDSGEARLREFATPKRSEQVEYPQMRFDFAQEEPSILPPLMPLEIAHPMRLQPTTKKGAVSHEVRIFFEALMALEPNQHQADIMFRLGDLISYLYPDGKFNRTNQLPHIIKALDVLRIGATVPFRDDQGDLRRWVPVYVKSLLEKGSKNETPVFMRVEMPPDTRQGYMIVKDVHRRVGKASGPQFNAYHAAAWLWDKHGTTKHGLIAPTRPVENRNDSGQLVDLTGKVIVTPQGKPITNAYHPRALAQVDREPNPAAERYPVLSDNDLILACFPNGYPQGEGKKYIKRAKAHWRELEKRGIISILEEKEGWRILPSEPHLKAYRGLRQAIKKGKR